MDNFSNLSHLLNARTSLLRQVIPIHSTSFLSDIVTFYLLVIILLKSNFKIVCNQIHLLLQLNQLQQLIIKAILDYIDKKIRKIYFGLDQQSLIYIRSGGKVRKSKVVKAIKMDFSLLGKRKKLVILVLTGSIANGIGESMVYITLRIYN